MKLKSKKSYYDIFVEMVDYSCQAASMLHEALCNFQKDSLPEKMQEIHKIEHSADILQHETMNALAKEFITPIEREDVISLSSAIDNVTDSIEDVLMRVYMFNIQEIRQEAQGFSSVIMQCCAGLKAMMEEFHNFRKSTTIQSLIVNINRLEEEGDTLYTEALRNLFVNEKEPVQIFAWAQMFEQLEKCCDKCEDVADVVSGVIMKNGKR